MRWIIVIGAVIVIALVMSGGSKKTTDVDKMMKRCRAAKAKKARERKGEITYTPPAKTDGGIMKVA